MKKMKYMLSFLLLTMLSACNPPSTRKTPRPIADNTTFENETTGTQNGSTNTSTSGDTSVREGDSSIVDDQNGSSDPDFAHCNLESSYPYSHSHIGSYHICQSQNDDKKVGLRLKDAVSNYQVCLAPLTKNSNGTTYIGEIQCFQANQSEQTTVFNFIKNRRGYEAQDLSAVMIMQDRPYYYDPPYNAQLLTPDAFLRCMDWLAHRGQDIFCRAFANAYNRYNHYVVHNFR